jgi:GNAT superfamily N-acetyltransferase
MRKPRSLQRRGFSRPFANARRIDRGDLHVAYDRTTPIGTFALDRHIDPKLGHDDPDDDLSGYLHRLAVARIRAGKGTGAQLVEHADRRVAAAGDGDGFASLARRTTPGYTSTTASSGFTHVGSRDLYALQTSKQ